MIKFTPIEYVAADDPQITWTHLIFNFRTIGRKTVPVASGLPSHVRVDHQLWANLQERILRANNNKFAQLDKIYLDLRDLEDLIAPNSFGDADNSDLWKANPDYSDWFHGFDDQWADLTTAIEELAESVLIHVPPHTSRAGIREWQKENGIEGVEPLPNRVPPPTLRQALQMMIAAVDEFERRRAESDSN